MDISALQDEAQLQALAQRMSRPPPQVQQAVTFLAHRLGLDPAPMLAGEGFVVKDVVFQVMHTGPADVQGLTLLAHLGPVPDGDEATLRNLLESNVANPAADSGIYGILPGTGTVVMRSRIALRDQPDPAADVLAYIDAFTTQVQSLRGMLAAGADLAALLDGGE
ncbi:MAG: hypothetical protein LCH79_01500 [Proteobacteria bacterium]|nr:hypothetical protein [Pseudomonadota bacterium]